MKDFLMFQETIQPSFSRVNEFQSYTGALGKGLRSNGMTGHSTLYYSIGTLLCGN